MERSFLRNGRTHYGPSSPWERHVLSPSRRFAWQICREGTHAVRAAIQRSQGSLATLSRELGINPKTVSKWRKRTTVEDLKTGPRAPRSTVLTQAEEAMIIASRGTHCCLWTTASMLCNRRSRIHWLTGYRAAMSREADAVSPSSLPETAWDFTLSGC